MPLGRSGALQGTSRFFSSCVRFPYRLPSSIYTQLRYLGHYNTDGPGELALEGHDRQTRSAFPNHAYDAAFTGNNDFALEDKTNVSNSNNMNKAEAIPFASSGFSPQAVPTPAEGTLQPDEDQEDEGEGGEVDDSVSGNRKRSLSRQRKLYHATVALQEVIEHEIRAEVERDSVDGAEAVPPLPPEGWAVHHFPGTSFFVMTRILNPLLNGDAGSFAGAEQEPRYRSIHEENLLKYQQGVQKRMLSRASLRTPTGRSNAPSSSLLVTSADSPPQVGARKAATPNLFHSSGGEKLPAKPAAMDVVRSQAHLTLFAPFRVQDLSYHDPTISICEWSTFDLLVRKVPPPFPVSNGMVPAPSRIDHNDSSLEKRRDGVRKGRFLLQGQQRLWDQRECMYLRLASVNSELRIRSIQFLSAQLARSLEEFAVFGQGDPFFGELLREYKMLQHRPSTLPRRVSNVRKGGGLWDSTAIGSAESEAGHSFSAFPMLASSGERLLSECWEYTGDVARTLAYGGPYLTELSKELHDVLLTYIVSNLRINHTLVEYVCQTQYFIEQEEYMGWLGRWQVMAKTLQQGLRSSSA